MAPRILDLLAARVIQALLVTMSLVLAEKLVHRHFMARVSFNISAGTWLNSSYNKGVSVVSCANACVPDICGMFVYSHDHKLCRTFRDRYYQNTYELVQSPGWAVFYKDDSVVYGDWTLVFRGQSATQKSVVDYWWAAGQHDDNPVQERFPRGCLQFSRNSSCRQHFRSYVLDEWTDIAQVRYSLYKDGTEVKHVIFDGRNSTSSSWWDKSRILAADWDFAGHESDYPVSYFLINSTITDTSRRTFYIFGPHNGCNSDYTYTFVAESRTDNCWPNWGISQPPPAFVYSRTSSATRVYRREYGLADALAVFVKFGRNQA